jgi:hypothetical protein
LALAEKELQQARKDNQVLTRYIHVRRKKKEEDAQMKEEEEARKKAEEEAQRKETMVVAR